MTQEPPQEKPQIVTKKITLTDIPERFHDAVIRSVVRMMIKCNIKMLKSSFDMRAGPKGGGLLMLYRINVIGINDNIDELMDHVLSMINYVRKYDDSNTEYNNDQQTNYYMPVPLPLSIEKKFWKSFLKMFSR